MSTRDLGASVRQRLLNQAKAQFRPFQEVMQYYAMERFLYRLARSPHTDEFILKGALLLSAWRSPLSRSTMDIDLLGKTSNKLDHIRSIFSNICVVDVEPDGISFDPASLETTRIKEDADYEGVRVHFNGILARARISMQIDIGFGDVVIPEITTIEYPTMLEFPVPVSKRAAPAPFTDKIDKVHKPANASGEPSGHSRFQSHRSSASSFRRCTHPRLLVFLPHGRITPLYVVSTTFILDSSCLKHFQSLGRRRSVVINHQVQAGPNKIALCRS